MRVSESRALVLLVAALAAALVFCGPLSSLTRAQDTGPSGTGPSDSSQEEEQRTQEEASSSADESSDQNTLKQVGEDQYANEEQVVAPGSDDECPGATEVFRLSGNGNRQSAPFRVEGDRGRVTISIEATSRDPSLAVVTVDLLDAETRDLTGSTDFEGEDTDSSVINVGPGRFFLDTNTANAKYEVVVEDCAGEPADDDDDIPNRSGRPDGDVMNDKDRDELVNTGGVSPALLGALGGGLVLSGAGLALLLLMRRGKRRA